MNANKFKDTLNGKNLLSDFNLVIQTGTAGLLDYPERKESLSNDWAEENGQEYDLSSPKFKDKEVTLSCAMMAPDDGDFWFYYQAFFSEIAKPGWQDLYIYDHSQTYKVFYKKTSGFVKSLKRLKDVPTVFVKFQLTLQVKFA
ncbi:hypothetical protein BFF93_15675 [Elizabethkingia meningoseptica]|uniref:hypothetical protein n=1 Tax=Elizabethkingia meningoseptica TaxID=238 RepID=UPI000841EA8B|nr:hypothetical protein [Elizabethkingia meningoseptica]ODM52219.1 hypothetical protein BES09_15700 [Elizabethkingia meningoseptica]OHT26979.1 hypothetical protein BFF93_15675 [Elizabethkingia meningoseptica]OPC10843.1 hypothetical protein BAX93_10450 [Elizabethkingia meningoseptica]